MEEEFTLNDIITRCGVVNTLIAGAEVLAVFLGTCLLVWFAFKLFYKSRRAAGGSLGGEKIVEWDEDRDPVKF